MGEDEQETRLVKKFIQTIELEAARNQDTLRSLAGDPLCSAFSEDMSEISCALGQPKTIIGLKTSCIGLEGYQALCLRHYLEGLSQSFFPQTFFNELNTCLLTCLGSKTTLSHKTDTDIVGLMYLHRKTMLSPQADVSDLGPFQKAYSLMDESAKRGRDTQNVVGRVKKIMSQKPHPTLYDENKLLFSDEKILKEKIHKAYSIHLHWWGNLKKRFIKHAVKDDYADAFLRLRGFFTDPIKTGDNNRLPHTNGLTEPLASLYFIKNQNLITHKIYCIHDGLVDARKTLVDVKKLLETQTKLIKNHNLSTLLGPKLCACDYETLTRQPFLLTRLIEALR